MKKIKFIPLVLIAIALITTSCAIDKDDPVIPREIITKTVSLVETSQEIFVPSSATPYDLAVMVDQAFGSDALVEYTMDDADGGTTMFYGNTEASIPVDVSEVGAEIFITLTNVSVLNKPDTVKAVIDDENMSIKIIVVPEPNPDSIGAVFFNEDSEAAIWFGFSEFSDSGSWLDDYNQNSNGSYPRLMSIPLDGEGNLGTIPNSSSVAPNILALNLYPQLTISNPLRYSIVLVMPDGTVQVLSGELSSNPGVDNAVVLVEVTDDAANPGMKSYVFSNI